MADGRTEDLTDAALVQFRILQRNFVGGLPGRWLAIAEGSSAAARLMALHQLAGSAGSYGFDRLGALAREAEKLVSADSQTATAPTLALLQLEMDAIQAAWAAPANAGSNQGVTKL